MLALVSLKELNNRLIKICSFRHLYKIDIIYRVELLWSPVILLSYSVSLQTLTTFKVVKIVTL